MAIFEGFVLASDGNYYVQKIDANAKFGFSICDDEQSWEVFPGTWVAVKIESVPEAEVKRLGWILEEK
jgi:hypothetical protein